MKRFVLQKFFDHESGEESAEDIVTAIKYYPERVSINTVTITDALDVKYFAEVSKLPDFNRLSASKKAVLVALTRFVRLRMHPATFKLTNAALWDLTFLQALHSQLINGVAESAAPRVISHWLDFNRADNITSLCQSSCLALDAVFSGNVDLFRSLVLSGMRHSAGFALQQLPDLNGWTFLHFLASCTHHTEAVILPFIDFMLNNNVNVNSLDYSDRTPLHVACEHFHVPAILLLAVHPLASVRVKNASGHIPLQLFLGQLKVHRVAPDSQQLLRVIQVLTPYEDYSALLLNSSSNCFRPGLIRGLLHSSRDVAYFFINKLSGVVTANDAKSTGSHAIYTTLIHCVKHCINFYFSQLINIAKEMTSSKDWHIAEWQLFCAVVHYGLVHHNLVAVYWSLDHLCANISFDLEDTDNAALMLTLAKYLLLLAVRLGEGKLLAGLLRKLPAAISFKLLTECSRTRLSELTKPLQSIDYISAEDFYLLQKYSLLELVCVHHCAGSLAILLKHLHIQNQLAYDAYAPAYQDALSVSVCTADLACIDVFRDCLGVDVLAGLIFSSGESDTKHSVYEIYVRQLRLSVLRTTHNHNASIVRPEFRSLDHRIMLELLAKLAANARHLNLYAPVTTKVYEDEPKHAFSERIGHLEAIIDQKLIFEHDACSPHLVPYLIYMVNRAIPAASKLTDAFNSFRGRWDSVQYSLRHRRHRYRIAMRKLCRGFVPDQKWLHLSQCIVTIFDALQDQPVIGVSTETPRLLWSTMERSFSQALKSPELFDSFMARFLGLSIEQSSVLDGRPMLGRLSSDVVANIRSIVNNPLLPMQVETVKRNIAVLPFSKESEKNRRYVGDNDISLLYNLLNTLVTLILEEHELWQTANANTTLISSLEELVPQEDCDIGEHLAKAAKSLSSMDWLVILHCQLECEHLKFMAYFLGHHKSLSTLPSLILLAPNGSTADAANDFNYSISSLFSNKAPNKSIPCIASESILNKDELVLACLRIDKELIQQQPHFHKRRLLLPLILPMCRQHCYESAKSLLSHLKYDSRGTDNNAVLDLYFMSNLGAVVTNSSFDRLCRRNGDFQCQGETQLLYDVDASYVSVGHNRLSVLTPIHFALLHRERDFLSMFVDCFPLFKVDYRQLREFVCENNLHGEFCHFMYSLDNIHLSFFVPSLTTTILSVSDCFNDLASKDRVNKALSLARIADSAVLSLQSLQWRHQNGIYRYSNILSEVERLALNVENQLAHRAVNRGHLDCESDFNVVLMDRCMLPAKAVVNNAYNLARAMPIQLHTKNSVYSLVHAVVLCDQISVPDKSIVLKDFLSTMPNKLFRFMQQVHSLGVRDSCQLPLDRLLLYQDFDLFGEVLSRICESVNLCRPTSTVLEPAALQSRLYEKLVYYCSYHPKVLRPLEYTQYNLVLASFHRNDTALSNLSIRNELCTMLQNNLKRLQGDFDIQYIGFDAVVQRQLYLKLGLGDSSNSIIVLSDFMVLLPLLQQYTTYLFDIMTRPLLVHSRKLTFDHPMRYFMQFSLSSSYEKFDIFVRARQLLSVLNIPFSQLAQTCSSPPVTEIDDDGDFRTLRLCESLSMPSFNALKDLVSGFYNLRSQSDAEPGKTGHFPCPADLASIGRKQLRFAKLKTEECLVLYHSPFCSLVELGSSGLTVPQFMRRLKLGKRLRSSLDEQYSYKALSQTNENFDLFRVLQLESKGHGSLSHYSQSTPVFSDGLPLIDMGSEVSASLMIALDMAYLIMEFGRFIALQKTLLLCSSTCSTGWYSSVSRAETNIDTPGSHIQRLLHQKEVHPLYAQRREMESLLQDQVIIRNVLANCSLCESKDKDNISLLPLKGYDTRLCICDGLQAGMLKMFLHLNVAYSARITKMRDILTSLLVNLLIDFGHVNFAELLCRVLLSHGQKTSISKSFVSADRTNGDIHSSKVDAAKPSKSYVRAEDSVETFQYVLNLLQSITVEMLVSFSHRGSLKRFCKEFDRWQGWFSGISDAAEDRIDPNEWKESIDSLKQGAFFRPNKQEVTYIMNILTDFQTSKDIRTSKKVDVIDEAVANLNVMCQTLSILYWQMAALYGIIQKDSKGFKSYPEFQLYSSRVLYDLVFDFRKRMLIKEDCVAIELRSVAIKNLLSLGCQTSPNFPLSGKPLASISGIQSEHSDMLSLIEVAAIHGDAQVLQLLLETCFLDNEISSVILGSLKLVKTLVFCCLLAMPSVHKRLLRENYYRCVDLLLEYKFPLCSPSPSLSVLDLCVIQRAFPILGSLISAYMQGVASDRVLSFGLKMSTIDFVEMKFAPHLWAMVGLSQAVDNVNNHHMLSLFIWRLGHVKELKPINLDVLLHQSMKELETFLFTLRTVLPTDTLCGDISVSECDNVTTHLCESLRDIVTSLVRKALPLSWSTKPDITSICGYCPLLSWPQQANAFSLLYLVNRISQDGETREHFDSCVGKCFSLFFTYEQLLAACSCIGDNQNTMFHADTWSSSVQHPLLIELIQFLMGAIVYQNHVSVLSLRSYVTDVILQNSPDDDNTHRKVNNLWHYVLQIALFSSYSFVNRKRVVQMCLFDALLSAPSVADHRTLVDILTFHKSIAYPNSGATFPEQLSLSSFLVKAFVSGVFNGTGRDNQLAILLKHSIDMSSLFGCQSSILGHLCTHTSSLLNKENDALYMYHLYFSVITHNMFATLSVLLNILPVDVHVIPDGFEMSLFDVAIALGYRSITNTLKPLVNPVLLRAVSKMIYFLRESRLQRLATNCSNL